jgi:hypothetical protein
MAKDEEEEKGAGKPSKRRLDKAIQLVDELIDQGEHPGLAAKDFLNPTWHDRWYMQCGRLSESVESKTLQNRLKTRPEDSASSPTFRPSSLNSMLQTLYEVKAFLKDSLDDLENEEAAEKATDEAARKTRDVQPKKEGIQPSVPEGVIAKGKPGIRQDRNGHTAVWIYNNLTRDHSPSISGTCIFSFKDLRTGAPEGEKEVVNLNDAVIPVNSILVFEPIDQNRCVSEYRVRLVIKRIGKEERMVEFGYGDPGCGKCLTKFIFHCVESKVEKGEKQSQQ